MQAIEAIEANLPNGFHDALLRELHVDYVAHRAVFALDVLTSTPESERDQEYRRGELTILDALFIIVDPPGMHCSLKRTSPSRIDCGSGQPSTAPIELPTIPAGYFLHWFFIDDLNAFVRVAARSATFNWLNDKSSSDPNRKSNPTRVEG